MSENPKPQKEGCAWGRRLKRVVLAILGLGVLLLLVEFALLARDCLEPTPAPAKADNGLDVLLKAEHSPPSKTASHPVFLSSGAPALKNRDSRTSVSRATAAPTTLKHPPLIPDTPDIPKALSRERDAINRQWDQALDKVEAYEKKKTRLSPVEAERVVEQIIREAFSQTVMDMINKNNPFKRPLKEGVAQIYWRARALEKWYIAARTEIYARQKSWIKAGRLSWNYRLLLRQEWMNSQPLGQPVYKSDFYRVAGQEAWQREIYYYQQQGGVNGYACIAGVWLLRQNEELRDACSKMASAVKGLSQ